MLDTAHTDHTVLYSYLQYNKTKHIITIELLNVLLWWVSSGSLPVKTLTLTGYVNNSYIIHYDIRDLPYDL